MPLKEGQWLIPVPGKISWAWALTSRVVIASVFMTSKLWIKCLNKMNVYNQETFLELTQRRPAGRGLLTVCNHTCCIDDPLMIGRLMKLKQALKWDSFIWTSAADDVAFGKNYFWSMFFSLGKIFPVVRGDGVYQKGMDFMVERLDLGDWCLIFPEGKINAENEFMRIKWGVGRVIADCKTTPIVLPMWHVGMDDVLPNKEPYIPLIGKRVTLLIGEPMDFTEDVQKLKISGKTPREIRKFITDRIQEEFKEMKEKAEALHKGVLSV